MKHILNIFAALIVALISTMPSTADCAYDVRHYGARGDGRKLDSPAIQRAIDRCSHRGGGVVTLPGNLSCWHTATQERCHLAS